MSTKVKGRSIIWDIIEKHKLPLLPDANHWLDSWKYITATSGPVQTQRGANQSGMPNQFSIIDMEKRLRSIFNKHDIWGSHIGGDEYFFETGLLSTNQNSKLFTYDDVKKVLMSAKDSQDEEKRLLEYFWGYLPTSDNSGKSVSIPRVSPAPEQCAHNWKLYNGFNEDYYYCTHCDSKRPLDTK